MKVIMFHYVMPKFDYYHFDLNLFEQEIKYLTDKYKVISLSDYDLLSKEKKETDENYVILTFDDGTIDHYKYVYPILKKYNCSGLFFIPSCTFKNSILDVQLIHKLLSLNKFEEMYDYLMEYVKLIKFPLNNLKLFGTYDEERMRIFKQLLQYILPMKNRKEILHRLCKKYNVSTLTTDYYMSIDQLKEMKDNGMFFGIHTTTHPRLSLLEYNDQYHEISKNMEYLLKNKLIDKNLISIAYPFGLYNNDTLSIAKKLGIKYGFKADVTNKKSLLEIDRIDCKILKEE